MENVIMNGPLDQQTKPQRRTLVRYRDGDGKSRQFTIRALPIGVVKAIEGTLKGFPDADKITIVLTTFEYDDQGSCSRVKRPVELEFNLKKM